MPKDDVRAKPSVLVMRGGGARGLALAGAWEVLVEAGFVFTTFVGTSAGAITAALLATGATPEQLRKVLQPTNFRLFLDGWFPTISLLARGWLYKGDYFVQWMANSLYGLTGEKRTTMSSLPRRALVFAAGPELGLVTFDSLGANSTISVARAVRYSMSIPLFFRPDLFDGRRIYDGGMLANFPIRRAMALCNTDDFIGLYLDSGGPASIQPRLLPFELLDVWMNQNENEDIDRFRSEGKVVSIDTNPIGTLTFDLSEGEKAFLLLCGEVAALKFLNAFGSRFTLALTG